MSWFNRDCREVDGMVADSLSGDASGSLFSRLAGGVIAPLAVAAYGLHSCLTQKAYLYVRGMKLELNDRLAICYGVAVIGLALFLHFYFIWTVSSRLYRYAGICKLISLLILIIGFGYVLWRVILVGVA